VQQTCVGKVIRSFFTFLRHALGDRESPGDRQLQSPFLLITRTHVQFNPASNHWLDLAEFHTQISQSDLPGLEQVAALYCGPFLGGLSIADSPAFDEWMLWKGEEIQRSVTALLDRLAALHLAGGNTAEAARWAPRQLELDP
jgi:hypothetical protein